MVLHLHRCKPLHSMYMIGKNLKFKIFYLLKKCKYYFYEQTFWLFDNSRQYHLAEKIYFRIVIYGQASLGTFNIITFLLLHRVNAVKYIVSLWIELIDSMFNFYIRILKIFYKYLSIELSWAESTYLWAKYYFINYN